MPSFELGPVTLRPAASAQYSVVDRSEILLDDGTVIPEATGTQFVGGAELTAELWRVKVFGEFLAEQLSEDFVGEELNRSYVLAGATVDLLERDAVWLRNVRVNGSYQVATYAPERLDESFLTTQLHLRLNELIGFTGEFVRWQIPRLEEPLVVNRVEWILHIYY